MAAQVGLDFVHYNGASGHYYYPEILGPGVALFDYDNDGDLDVYIAQGRALGADAPAPPAAALPLRGRLFRNDLRVNADGTRTLHFTDVTEQSGIRATGFGLGVAVGDIDNDGWPDLYLMNFGDNQMLHNNGDGTFTDVTKESGTANHPDFGVSAAFLDYDRDGWLDLYVGNNVRYTLADRTACPNTAGAPDYCPPQIYGGRPDRLYHNVGRGKFVDVTAKALAGAKFGPALGVSTADFNGDGWVDIFVANDGEDDLLFINQKNGTFKESALSAGVAVTSDGKAEASMGVDAGDFDNDGDDDLVMTELTSQGSNLYLNDGHAAFRDAGAQSGLGAFSLPYTGWGTSWFDFDNDGWLDVLAVNGTIVAQEGHRAEAFPYDQKKLLLRNLGNGRFEQVTSKAGRVFDLSESGRGAAFGDIDNDGDVDVLIANDSGPVRLLRNNLGNRNHWLGLRLINDRKRDALGARVGITRSTGPTLWRRVRSDGSYGSANDPRVLIGLGPSTEKPRVQIQWPDGKREEWTGALLDRWTTLTEGGVK
jgi:enediyne biosynthesis protein E4